MEGSSALDELRRAAAAEVARLERLVAAAEEGERQLEQRRAETTHNRALQMPGRVQLDVGGKKFFTTAAALQAKRGFFAALCEGVGDVQRDSEGCIFIDRSPLAFRFVLNHLRGEPIDTAMMTALEKEMLMLDAEFYELDELSELIGGAKPKTGQGNVVTEAQSKCAKGCMFACKTCGSASVSNDTVDAAYKKAEADLNRRRKEWEAKNASRERLKQKIEATVSSEKIKLQLMQEEAKFSTQQRTLTCKGGMLAAKFSSRERWNADVCDDGSVFIDKDGATFEWVLNLLRGYSLPRALAKQQRVSLAHDLEYFGLDLGLMKSGWNLMPSPNGVVSNDGLTFTKTQGGGSMNCGVIGSAGWTAGVHEWTVLLEAKCEQLMVGVAPSSLNLQGQNFDRCGFYLYCFNGTLYGQGVDDKAYNPSGACNANGTRISVRLDCDAHTLTFGINGTWLPIAYTGLPNVELFPSFDVLHQSCKFSIEI